MPHKDRVRSKKCSETEPKRYWTGEFQDQDLDLYYHCKKLYCENCINIKLLLLFRH